MHKYFLFFTVICLSFNSCGQKSSNTTADFNYKLSEKQWKAKLSSEQFYVLRKKGTEAPFQNKYWDNKKSGLYVCAGCKHPLFSSKTKFQSGTGWPSFYNFIENGIDTDIDNDIGYLRNEVHCANCGGHLGHVFDDGPKPTGKRFCINSIALNFEEN